MNDIIWQPSQASIEKTNLRSFQRIIEDAENISFNSYLDFHSWTLSNQEKFWRVLSSYLEVNWHRKFNKVMDQKDKLRETSWFIGGELNFAQNMIERMADTDDVLISFAFPAFLYTICGGRWHLEMIPKLTP